MASTTFNRISSLAFLLGLGANSYALEAPGVATDDFLPAALDGHDANIPGILSAAGRTVIAPNIGGLAAALTFKTQSGVTRGASDVSLFKSAANSVVLILTQSGLGSGSVIADNFILTNHHVVGDASVVTVVFKPSSVSDKANDREILKASVIKTDIVRDLALLKLQGPLPYSVIPLALSEDKAPDVGTDVAAIGHPTGEAWTYTKGIISQVRLDYEWSGGPGDPKHRADVIQTQTPINPGNSGGPLLSVDRKIVGVNSFRTKGGEGLNFAVAAGDIQKFLSEPARSAALNSLKCDKATVVYEGRNKANNGFMKSVSLKCDNFADVIYALPDAKTKPMIAIIDIERTGRPYGIVYDPSRTAKWSASIWDPKLDSTFPVKGVHKGGQLMPVRYAPRCPAGKTPLQEFKCSR